MRERAGVRVSRSRALRLLVGGAVGGAVCWLACLAGFGLTGGADGLRWAGIGGGVAMGFFILGALVRVAFAESVPVLAAGASLVSYLVRAGGLLLLLLAVGTDGAGSQSVALAVSVIAVVIGWLALEIWTFTRLRIPAFDPPADS